MNTERMKLSSLLLSLLCFLFGLSSCSSSIEGERPLLVTSIEPLRYLTEQIAGDRYEVQSLAPVGVSPEAYEPTPQQLVTLSHAKAYFAIGTLGFEQTQLKKVVEETADLHIHTLTDSLTLLANTHTHSNEAYHAESATDLHVWMSPKNMKKMAAQVCAVLSALDSAAAPYFHSRLQRFLAKTDSIDNQIRLHLKPIAARTFLIYHPSLAYFAHDYGLQQIAIEEDGKEPTPKALAQLMTQTQAAGVRTVFVQEEYSGKIAYKIAEEMHLPVERINPLTYDWDKEILRIATLFR